MLIALPNFDGSFTCTLFFPFEGVHSFSSIKTKDDAMQFFSLQFPDAVNLMPNLIDDYFTNPTSSLVTVKCFPWIHEDKSMLIGDSAHAIVPFYGQGMNAGFEDCRILMEIIDASSDKSWGNIFSTYQEERKKNGDAVADLALQNFIEMRDLVADPIFLTRKKIEKQLGILYPEQFNSVYEMVSFSHTPYHTAISCQKAQDIVLHNIMSRGDFDINILDQNFKAELDQWIDEYSITIRK
jgi:kynurenine 3-monooxygenase